MWRARGQGVVPCPANESIAFPPKIPTWDGGALVATAIAAVLGLYLRRIELREEARLKEAEERQASILRAQEQQMRDAEAKIAASERDRELMWSKIEGDLARLGEDMNHMSLETDLALINGEVRKVGIELSGLRQDVWAVRTKLDPSYEHPYKSLHEQVFSELEEQVRKEREAETE
jgi:hypothetical protein